MGVKKERREKKRRRKKGRPVVETEVGARQ